jgi:hypothetical protein
LSASLRRLHVMTSGQVLSPSSLAVKRFDFLTKRLLAVLKETLIDLTDESIDIFAQFVRICRWLQLIYKDRLVLL